MEVIEIKEEEFTDKVLNSEKKVLVDFFADWCGPCRMLGPVISEVAESDDNYFYFLLQALLSRGIYFSIRNKLRQRSVFSRY